MGCSMANKGKNALKQKIATIKSNIAEAYVACEEKNATMPSVLNSANLAETIRSIVLGSTDITQVIGDFAKYNITMTPIADGVYSLDITDYIGQVDGNYYMGDITIDGITSLHIVRD